MVRLLNNVIHVINISSVQAMKKKKTLNSHYLIKEINGCADLLGKHDAWKLLWLKHSSLGFVGSMASMYELCGCRRITSCNCSE
jgi:hypothetical protein